MPPAQESKDEQIVVRMVEVLAAIAAGADYFYTPTTVTRCEGFWEEYFTDAADAAVLYLLRPGDEPAEEDTDHEHRKEMEVWLVVAKRYQPTVTENPFLVEAPIPWTIQNRIVHDVEKALFADVTQGLSFLENTEVRDRNRSFLLDGFICVEFRIVFKYSHLSEEP